MSYMLKHIPEALERELEKRAAMEGRDVSDVAIAALARGLGLMDGIAGDKSPGVGAAADLRKKRQMPMLPDPWIEDDAIRASRDYHDTIDSELKA